MTKKEIKWLEQQESEGAISLVSNDENKVWVKELHNWEVEGKDLTTAKINKDIMRQLDDEYGEDSWDDFQVIYHTAHTIGYEYTDVEFTVYYEKTKEEYLKEEYY